DVAPVADGRWWHRADQHIASDPAGVARREGQHQHPEEIELVPDPRHRAAEREDEGAGQIEYQQQRLHHDLLALLAPQTLAGRRRIRRHCVLRLVTCQRGVVIWSLGMVIMTAIMDN